MKLTPGITLTTEMQSLLNCGNEILDESQGTSEGKSLSFNIISMPAGTPWC